MAKNKTAFTDKDVTEFIQDVENEKRRADSFMLIPLFQSVTGFAPQMYGPTIVGFGKYHYKYASGHEGVAPLAAFSPRKDSLVLYFESAFENRDVLLSKLGKYKVSKACVYVKKLEDIDLEILAEMIKISMAKTNQTYPDKL